MGAVAKIVEAPFKAVESVGKAVGKAVSDVGNFVNKEVIQPVAKTVEKTVQAALDDPIGTAAKVTTAIYAPYLLPATNAAVALAHGASVDDALKSATVTMITQGVAEGVGDYVRPEMAETFSNSAVANAATSATANVAAAVATGQDPTQALVSSASMSAAGAVAKQIPGFNDLSKTQKNAAVSAISATLQGKDATQAVINQAIADGIDAANKYVHADDKAYQDLLKTNPNIDTETLPNTPATTTDELNQELFPADTGAETTPITTPGSIIAEDLAETTPVAAPGSITTQDLLSPTTSDIAPQLPTPETPATETPVAEEPVKETPAADQGFDNTALNDFYQSIGLDPESITKASAMTDDPLEMYSQAYDEQFMRDYYESIGIDPDSISPASPMEEDPLAYLNPDPIGASQKSLGQMFKSFIPANLNLPTPTMRQSSVMPLLQNAALYGGAGVAISSLLDENGNPITSEPVPEQSFYWNQMNPTAPEDGVAYGESQLNPAYAAQGGLMSLARGGISTLGGYSDGGRLLKGPGDGMSDNIPAMIGRKQPARLADGEFVVPADVVSHLGNGSTEAGANVLYKMMEKVRRARTGNVKQGRQINPNKFIPS